jgi:hypothetical protein
MKSGIFGVQQRGKSLDSNPRLQSKPFIYSGFIEVGSQSFTGIFTCLAARSETGHCTVMLLPGEENVVITKEVFIF